MAELIVDGDDLVVRMRAVERLEALHDEVRVKRKCVMDVHVLDDAEAAVHGLRLGTGVPGWVAIGTFTSRNARIFAVVHHTTPRGVQITLKGAQFDQIIIGCVDPEAVVASLHTPL